MKRGDQVLYQAGLDYQLLLDKGYPVNAVLKIVGDRFGMDRDARIILFRGVLPTAQSCDTSSRLLEDRNLPAVSVLHIDGYNVLLTLLNYRTGKPVFRATDRMVRDAGGVHGKIKKQDLLFELMALTAEELGKLSCRRIVIYLDAPISHSREHAVRFSELLNVHNLPSEVILSRNPDYPLSHAQEGILCSADSQVIRESPLQVFDLAASILERTWQFSPAVDFSLILG